MMRITLACVVSCVAAAALGAAQAPHATLAGHVVTHERVPRPIVRATVVLTGSTLQRKATTDENGRFVFTDLPADRFSLIASKPPFIDLEYGAMHTGEPGTPIVLGEGKTLDNLVIPLPLGAVITGTVRDEYGQPAASVTVKTVPWPAAAFTSVTDDRGVYRIFGLPAGEYVVGFVPPRASLAVKPSSVDVDAVLADVQRRYGRGRGSIAAPGAPTPAPGAAPAASAVASTQPRASGYATVYYPGTTRYPDAPKVTVAEGEERTGIDFPLLRANTTRITGSIVDANGKPAANAFVLVTALENSPAAARPSVQTLSAPGTFAVVNVTPGRYTLSARINKPDTGATLSAANADVEVGNADVAGVELRLAPAITFAGRVMFDAAPPSGSSVPSLTSVSISLRTAGVPATAPVEPIRTAAVKPDGTFSVGPFVPGRYDLTSSLAKSDWRLESVVVGGRDLLDEPSPNLRASVAGTVVTFTNRHWTLGGTFQNASGAPATEFFVVVVSQNRQFWQAGSRRTTFVRPGTDGGFSFADLPPGDYWLAALRSLDPQDLGRSSFLEQLAASAVRVRISGTGDTRQDLRVAQ